MVPLDWRWQGSRLLNPGSCFGGARAREVLHGGRSIKPLARTARSPFDGGDPRRARTSAGTPACPSVEDQVRGEEEHRARVTRVDEAPGRPRHEGIHGPRGLALPADLAAPETLRLGEALEGRPGGNHGGGIFWDHNPATFRAIVVPSHRTPLRTLEGRTVGHRTAPSLPNARRLRASIPRIIVEALDLRPGDALPWSLGLSTARLMVTKTERPPKRR